MSLLGLSFLGVSVYFSAAALTAAFALTFARLAAGPSVPDRVAALDLLATSVIAVTAVWAVATGRRALLDAAIVLALIAFLGTVAFASYLVRGARRG